MPIIRGEAIFPKYRGPALPLGAGASSPAVVSSEIQDQISKALRFQHAWFLRPPVAIHAMDLIKDPSYSRNTDADMASSSGLVQMSPWPPVA